MNVEEARKIILNMRENEPKLIGFNDEFHFVYVPGKHGKICVLVPKNVTPEEDLEAKERLHRVVAEIAVKQAMMEAKSNSQQKTGYSPKNSV